MTLFPCLNGLLTLKDGSFFLSVPDVIKLVLDVSENIVEKDDHFYVKCSKIEDLKRDTIKWLEEKGLIIKQDDSFYVKTVISKEPNLKVNNHANKERKKLYFAYQTIIKINGSILKKMGKHYFKSDNDFMKLDNEKKEELTKYEIIFLTGNSYYIHCPQKLFDYLNQDPLNDLIERKKNGDYLIPDPSLEDKCCRFLKHGRLSYYTFDAFVELVGVCLFVAVIWIGIFMLDYDDRNIGKVLVAVFLTYIPKSLGIFTTPWSKDASKSKKDHYINEVMKEELKKRQNALTLRYILIALQFYFDESNIARVMEELNEN